MPGRVLEGGIEQAELLGTVASLDASNGTFALQTADGRTTTVALTAQTEFDDGLTSPASLQSGMSVDVEGVQQPDGSIQASKVSLQDQNDQNGQDSQDDGGTDSGD